MAMSRLALPRTSGSYFIARYHKVSFSVEEWSNCRMTDVNAFQLQDILKAIKEKYGMNQQ